MVKILAPTPKIYPSDLNSMADETMELAKPVMGISVPAPVCLAISSNQWHAVRIAVKKISVTDTMARDSIRAKPVCIQKTLRSCPRQQMAPPEKKAQRQSFKRGEGGEAFSTMRLYSFGPTEWDIIGFLTFFVFHSMRISAWNIQNRADFSRILWAAADLFHGRRGEFSPIPLFPMKNHRIMKPSGTKGRNTDE